MAIQEKKKKNLQEKFNEIKSQMSQNDNKIQKLINKQDEINSYNKEEKTPFQTCLDNSTDFINC